MKNTNSKAFKTALQEYLLPIIEEKMECYGETHDNPYLWAVENAKKEIPHEFKRRNEQEALSYWLQGLALNIDYTYCDIIKAAEKMHDCVLTNKEADMVCDRWFSFIALKILQYSRD